MTSGILLKHSQPYFFEAESLTEPECRQQAPAILLSLPLTNAGVTDIQSHAQCLMWGLSI